MTVELRWLTAPDSEVAEAMAALLRDSRPSWVPTRRQVLLHVNQSLLLWYLGIVFFVFGVRVDGYHGGHATAGDVAGLIVSMLVFAGWLVLTWWLHRWAARPPSPASRLKEWRQTLTSLANGYESEPSPTSTVTSLITAEPRGVREFPRFAAPGVEFGTMTTRADRPRSWHYLAVRLPAPLPHLILDATSNDGIGSDLPAGVDRSQRLSLEGDFDRWFHTYAPPKYEPDALYVLTPDVMATLIDVASAYNVEIVDDTLTFFTSEPADFSRPEPWLAVDAVLQNVVPRVLTSAARYLDDHVVGQGTPRMISRVQAELADIPWVVPAARIGPNGRRLTVRDRRTGPWSVVGAIAWFTGRALLYAVPAIFAFAGFMSIVDGR